MRLVRAGRRHLQEHLDPLRDGRGLDGPDRRRAVGHGPRAQDGGKGPDLGGPRVGREKGRGLKSHPARSFSRRSARKTGKSTVWRPPVSFYPGGIRRGVEGLFPWETVARAPVGTDDSWSLRLRYGRGYRGTLTLPRGPSAMANPTCRTCDRSADAGAYCSSCAAGIMATALNPHFRGRRQRDFRQDPGHFRGDQDPTAGNSSGQQLLFRIVRISVTRCNDMRKIAACWTCGRTFWVWRLRERNFCSGKCRVRHHRSASQEAQKFRPRAEHPPARVELSRRRRQLVSISRSAPGSIFRSPLERAWYRVCLPMSM